MIRHAGNTRDGISFCLAEQLVDSFDLTNSSGLTVATVKNAKI
jgi:anti-sigma regulatory factor (Ser/Thr protein kinase)